MDTPGDNTSASTAATAQRTRADVAALQRLSSLLDEALELDGAARENWLAELQRREPELAARLRELLARGASDPDQALLQRGAGFSTVARRDSLAFEPGEQVGPYRLQRVLGRGGMGEVWLAESAAEPTRAPGTTAATPVALKLPLLAARRQVLVQRFERERDILRSLVHPRIARLLDAGIADDGQPYLALEFVEGRSLVEHCRDERLGVVAMVKLFLQVLEATQHAHANLVVHRDIKPSNVWVTPAGEVVLLDFGIAKLLHDSDRPAEASELTRIGGRALTPGYAAPELLRGEPVSIAVDVWSLGVLLYELIAGTRPFTGGSAAAVEQAALNTDPTPPSVLRHRFVPTLPRLARALAADLDTIVLEALAKAPAQRYVTAAAMAEDLQRWLAGEPVLARRDSPWYRTRKFVGRHRWAVAGTSLAAVALATTAGVAVWQAAEAHRQAALARGEAVRAEAVQDFLLDIFRANRASQRDPAKARQTSARELLDLGAQRVDERLKDAPQSRLRVLATLAAMYNELGLPARAVELDRQRLALARQALPAGDEQLAAALLGLSQRLFYGDARHEGRALLDEATAVLALPAHRDSPLQWQLADQSARFYRYESLQGAMHHSDVALQWAQTHAADDRNKLGGAYNRAAAWRLTSLDYAEAERLLAQARTIARERAVQVPAAIIPSSEDMADVQMSVGRFAQAEETLREALAASELANGIEHRVTLVFCAHLIYLYDRLGRRAEAEALRGRVAAALERAGDALEPGWRRNAAYLMTRHLHDAGRPDLLVAPLREVVQELSRDLPHSPADVHRKRYLADVLVSLGQLDEAAALIADAMAGWMAYTAGVNQRWMNGNLWTTQARLALAQGRPRDALGLLLQVVPSRMPADAPLDLLWARRNLVLSTAWLELGEAAKAEDAARQVLAALRGLAAPAALPGLEALAHEALASAQQRAGHIADARASLERALALRRGHDAAGSLWLAKTQRELAALPR